MQYDFIKTEHRLRKELDEDRYQHTLGVMFTASSLAMCHGADIQKAECAGLLHDCAKCIPNERKLKLCQEYAVLNRNTMAQIISCEEIAKQNVNYYGAEEVQNIIDSFNAFQSSEVSKSLCF